MVETRARGDVVKEAAPRPPRDTRLRVLDLLRFVAAAAVMLCHFTGAGMAPARVGLAVVFPFLPLWLGYGYLGTQLFFIISGFVILMSAWRRRPGDFLVSRVVRLFPAYWVSVLVAIPMVLAMAVWLPDGDGGHPARQTMWNLPANMTMVEDGLHQGRMIGVYWTLWLELHFYVLIAVALVVWKGRFTYRRCLYFTTGWLLASIFAVESGNSVLTSVLIPQYAPLFVAGMALYLVHRFGSNMLLWGQVGFCWLLSVHYGWQTVPYERKIPGVWAFAVPAVITGIYILMAVVAVGGLSWMRWRWLTPLGSLTYPLYLLHLIIAVPVVDCLYDRVPLGWLFVIAYGTPLLTAWLVYRCVEEPVQHRLKAWLVSAIAQARTAPDDPEP